MDLNLQKKVAVVTGASKGMGLATVEALLNEGVKVTLVARNKNLLEEIERKYSNLNHEIHVIRGDVADSSLPKKVIEQTIDKWGKVDILVNNAGGPPMGDFLKFDDQVWIDSFQTNLMSCIRFSKEVVPHMIKNNWGRIISITSTLAKEPAPSMVLSSTIRSGVGSFTKAISKQLAENNITANVVCPGGVSTDRLIELLKNKSKNDNVPLDNLMKQSQMGIPAKRFAQPKEIADTILFLASERGGYINGVSLVVDGSLMSSF